MIYKLLLFIVTSCNLFGNINWVNYGWELFDYILDAKSAYLGNSVTA